MRHLAQLPVLVLGLGESGLAMARWCAHNGAHVRAWDSREAPPHAATLATELPQVQLLAGALDPGPLLGEGGVRLILKSPGLAPHDPAIAPLLQAARAIGVRIAGELDLFALALADLATERGYAPKVLAITGTNGKTTTTAMTAQLVERTGLRVAVAGNIGPTMLDTLAQALELELVVEPTAPPAQATPSTAQSPPEDAQAPADLEEVPAAIGESADLSPSGESPEAADLPSEDVPVVLAPPPPREPVFEHLPQVWVLELSSFQLDDVQGFEPSAAVVLNVTQDHLDWHGSMPAYAAAKARIYGSHATLVVNRDDLLVEQMVPAPQVIKGARGRAAREVHRKVVRFGLGAPGHPGDFGLVVENGMAWLVRALEADETMSRRSKARSSRGTTHDDDTEIHLQRLMPADALRVRGRHNAANALAALALATAIGCPLAPMLHGLREYRGEPHRVEFVASIDAVEAYDDSKGTNVGATVAALRGLGEDRAPQRLVVILGGDGKGQDFTPLAEPIARHVRAVALIGRDAGLIERAIAGAAAQASVTLERHDTLPQAVAWCFAQAHAGDAVLLSPACASMDMFRNYAHRAQVFVDAVHAQAALRGEAAT
jgi:UDP-N-acetylmuramoylalanine--D-glutamate ligase